MEKAIIWGAGREGRGFLADIFLDAGWDVVFAEKDESLCRKLCEARQYTLWQCSAHGGIKPKMVTGFSVVNPDKGEGFVRLCYELAEAKILALCVYPHQYESVIKVLDRILGNVKSMSEKPICDKTILLGVNETAAENHFLAIARKQMQPENWDWFQAHIGVAPCIVRRTCTAPADRYRKCDPLGVMTNSYPELVIDSTGIKGEATPIKGVHYITDLQRELTIKLYTYNMLHAIYAYAGARKGYQTLWEAYSDPQIHSRAKAAVGLSCQAISMEYGISENDMAEYQKKMWSYAVCQELGDTIERLAVDPIRKLSCGDRIMGPILLCEKHGLNPLPFYETLVDALCYLDAQGHGGK